MADECVFSYSGNVAKLNNCVNDAKDVAVVLQQLNFMVMVVSDQTRSQMLACIRAFRQGIRDSDIVLLYFSGNLAFCIYVEKLRRHMS